MGFGLKAKFIELQTESAGAFTGSYIPLGSSFDQPAVLVKITNLTNQDVLISIDGVTDHDICPTMSGVVYDICTNKENGPFLNFQKGTQFFVNAAAGTGTIYLTAIYASEE